MESGFWTINFWGLLATMVAFLSLAVSWLVFKFSHPKINLEKVYLVTNIFLLEAFETGKFRDGDIFKIYTYFHALNANSGPGSFERPTLKMYRGDELILRLFPDHNGPDDRMAYLSGGQGKKIVQTYTFKFEEYRDEGLFQQMYEHDNRYPIHFELTYSDNKGVQHRIGNLQDREPIKEAYDFFNDPSGRIYFL